MILLTCWGAAFVVNRRTNVDCARVLLARKYDEGGRCSSGVPVFGGDLGLFLVSVLLSIPTKQQQPQLEGVVVRPLPTKINSQASLSNVLRISISNT